VSLRHGKGIGMCNLYSITTNQESIRALFRAINRYVGNLPRTPGGSRTIRPPWGAQPRADYDALAGAVSISQTLNLISKLNQRVFLRAPLPRYRRLTGHGRRSMSDKKTRTELYEMLAEAVRNTQPQPVRNTQPEPARPAQQRKTQPRNTRPAPKRTAKIKSVRASASRKQWRN
jgi:hypothetical protein